MRVGRRSSPRFETSDEVRELRVREVRGLALQVSTATRSEAIAQRRRAAVVHKRRASTDTDEARQLEHATGALRVLCSRTKQPEKALACADALAAFGEQPIKDRTRVVRTRRARREHAALALSLARSRASTSTSNSPRYSRSSRRIAHACDRRKACPRASKTRRPRSRKCSRKLGDRVTELVWSSVTEEVLGAQDAAVDARGSERFAVTTASCASRSARSACV